jgi:hypothetical protein
MRWYGEKVVDPREATTSRRVHSFEAGSLWTNPTFVSYISSHRELDARIVQRLKCGWTTRP